MPAKWRINDVMDLEYVLGLTGPEDSTRPEAKEFPERRLYLAYAETHTQPFSRRDLIKFWLDERRQQHRQNSEAPPLPGDTYREAMGLARILTGAGAALAGAALAWSVLSYSGKAPINIFTCLWVLLAPQTILILMLFVSFFLARANLGRGPSGVYSILAALFRRLLAKSRSAAQTALTADQRGKIQSLTGVLGGRRTLYGSIFFWPVFVLAQTMAVMFNLGILAAVLLKLSFTDLAFGWQSTLHPGPETVLSLVEGFSLPWSFLPAAHPSLAQIQGSQMVLKEGMVHLATPDLVSWWPFLCYALLWYGLAPRLLLLFFGVFRQRRLLNALNFSTGACDRLIHRMRTPVVHTQSRAYRPVPDSETEPEIKKTADASGRQQASVEALPALVLVPEDIGDLCHDPGLPMILEKALGLSTVHALTMTMDPDADMKTISSALETLAKTAEGPRLVLLMEAWQPPIRETLNWLTRLRQTAGSRMGVIVALLGKPGKEAPFPPPAPTDRMVWERAVTGLGDPFIRVESIGDGP